MGATSRAGTAHLPQHLSLPSVFSGNCAAQFLVFYIVFGLSFCPLSLGFCIICPSKLWLLIAPFDKFKACMLNNHKIWSSQIFWVMEIYLELYENAIYKRVQISVKTFLVILKLQHKIVLIGWLIWWCFNMPKWGDMSTHELLFQWASTMQIQLRMLI